jgi:hypothetical protein
VTIGLDVGSLDGWPTNLDAAIRAVLFATVLGVVGSALIQRMFRAEAVAVWLDFQSQGLHPTADEIGPGGSRWGRRWVLDGAEVIDSELRRRRAANIGSQSNARDVSVSAEAFGATPRANQAA